MNKTVMCMIIIIIILFGIAVGINLFANQDKAKEDMKIGSSEQKDEEVTDECTLETELEKSNLTSETNVIQTNSNDEKTSPNCKLIVKKYYKECGHTTTEYKVIESDLVNKTENEIKNEFSDYEITKFSSDEIQLYKEEEGECSQHYIVKDENGVIIIDKVENGKEYLYDTTDISTEYATQEDVQALRNGVEIFGDNELNQYIENFE